MASRIFFLHVKWLVDGSKFKESEVDRLVYFPGASLRSAWRPRAENKTRKITAFTLTVNIANITSQIN